MIEFKAKVHKAIDASGNVLWQYVKVPNFTRSHCDMPKFRKHEKYKGIANSDLFSNVLSKIKRDKFGNNGTLRLDALPEGVTIDTSGFLAIVRISL